MKIAIVIQRYGTEITGGSEHLCRMIAERFASRHEVDVLTTCAKDYISWKNEYPQGKSVINDVHVYRFPTTKTSDLESFNKFSEKIYTNYHTTQDELKWLEDQGPSQPGLIDFLSQCIVLTIACSFLLICIIRRITDCRCPGKKFARSDGAR